MLQKQNCIINKIDLLQLISEFNFWGSVYKSGVFLFRRIVKSNATPMVGNQKVLLQVFYILYISQVYYSLNLSYNLIHQYLLLINPYPQDKTLLKVHYYFNLCLFAMHSRGHKNKFYILILFLFSQILKILYLYQKLLFLLILLENLLVH